MKVLLFAAAIVLSFAGPALAQVRITEWMYNGTEFVELTNFGPAAVDFTGWSFDDDSRTPGVVSLSGFGSVAVGESVVLSEFAEADFRTEWSLPAAVKIIGGNSANLGRNDEINIFDSANALVDRLTFSDVNFPGTIRTAEVSGNPTSDAVLGTNNVAGWQLSFVGDAFGSTSHTFTDANDVIVTRIASPGSYPTAVPEPTGLALMLLSFAGLGLIRR